MSPLLRRLKRKKVVQWILAYLAGAFGALQLMDALQEPLGLSQQTQQAVVALLAMGVVITGIIAWTHGEKGRQRVSVMEVASVGVTLLVGVSMATALWTGSDPDPRPERPARQPRRDTGLRWEDSVTTEAGGERDVPQSRGGSLLAPEGTPVRERAASLTSEPPLVLTPASPSLSVGDSVHLSLNSDRLIQWSSSDPKVAAVVSDGRVRGVAPGVAEITATAGGIKTSTRITVQGLSVIRVEVAPVASLRIGDTVRARAVLRLADGQTLGAAGVTWASSDAAVVEVGPRGRLTAVAPGMARISASVGAVSGWIEVAVEDSAPIGAPVLPPVSDEVLLNVLERYRTALESRSLDAVQAIYPGLSPEEWAGWETLFALGSIAVEFVDRTIRQADARTGQVEFDQVLRGDRIERNTTRFVASLVSDGGVWRIQRLTSAGPSP